MINPHSGRLRPLSFINPRFLFTFLLFVSGWLLAQGSLAQVSELPINLPTSPIPLWPEKPRVSPDREKLENNRLYAVDNPAMVPFWPEQARANGAAVVLFPGGGYVRLAVDIEGEHIARWLNERGVAVFMVKYRMQEYGFPAPLLDGLRAVRLVRSQAEDWGLDSQRIGVMGFSAGGHLAASVTTRYGFRDPAGGEDPLGKVSARPDFSILGYPVITLEGPDAHEGSRRALLGESPSEQLVRENSLQHQVKQGVPPVFMLHGIGDKAVPVGNSLVFFEKVQRYNKSSELHVYPTNSHGFGMREGEGTASNWPQALEAWLQQLEILPLMEK